MKTARLPLCEAEGCRRRILDAGQPGVIMEEGRTVFLCGECAAVVAEAIPVIGEACGIVLGEHVIIKVLHRCRDEVALS